MVGGCGEDGNDVCSLGCCSWVGGLREWRLGGRDTRPADTAAASVETAAETPGPVTANRRETVDEKIQRLYERNGADFDARSPEDFLAKITAFTASPPAGTDRATRPNGDVLLYQASTNTFAVVDRAGTPRTMFKPDEGEAYWAEQKAAAPTFGQRRASN
jgi:pyocin large subunit-like protein